MRRALLILLLPMIGACGTGETSSPDGVLAITVSAGPFDRVETVVSFDPTGFGGSPMRLVDEDGRDISLQRGSDGRLWFVLDSLRAENSRTYRLHRGGADADSAQADGRPQEPDPGGAQRAVRAERSTQGVRLLADNRHVLTYNLDPTEPPRPDVDSIFRRGAYIHPMHTPSGVLVTDDYPPNHIHHHGIWSAWTSTRFKGRAPDFWNMGDSTGTVEPIALDSTWSGPVHGGFRARHRYVDLSGPQPENVLLETWEGRLYHTRGRDRSYVTFDLDLIQVPAGDSALYLPEYRYGGVGFRGHRQWDGAENTVFLTSEGMDRSNGHATRARWCHIGGRVDGEWAGIAVLDHPENFRAPQPMRIHPNEPFFNYAPSQAGDWAIRPGERYVARYRFVVYDGEPDPVLLDRLWNDYAHPPVVTVLSD